MNKEAGAAVTAQPTTETEASRVAGTIDAIVESVGGVIQGKPDVIELMVLCLLSRGHLLIEDVPGVGKTSLAKALARTIDCTFGRIQFTPDLLPSDVLGVNVWNRELSHFEFRAGPVFASIVLGDEINRASPKTQSALLEAMAESQITVDGVSYALEAPFMVIATQNPIEHEGTYPLPESQLDRFLMRLAVGYPHRAAEIEVLAGQSDDDALDLVVPIVSREDVHSLTAAVSAVHIAPGIQNYLVDLADVTRNHPQLHLGMSPRATISLQRVARAQALASGRAFVVPDDIKALAQPVLAHRLIPTPEAHLQGIRPADILAQILDSIPVPTSKALY